MNTIIGSILLALSLIIFISGANLAEKGNPTDAVKAYGPIIKIKSHMAKPVLYRLGCLLTIIAAACFFVSLHFLGAY